MRPLTDYLNEQGEPVTDITVVRVYGNGTRQVYDQNGKEIPELRTGIDLEELVQLAGYDAIWMGDHGVFDPPRRISPDSMPPTTGDG